MTDQPGLFDAVARKPRHRRHDPVGSLVAAELISPLVSEHGITIIRAILNHPGLTSRELAALPTMALDNVQIARRAKELEDLGLIVRTPCPRTHQLRMLATSKASNYFGTCNPAYGKWEEYGGKGGSVIADERLT
jgi:hypothetical protein